MLLYKKRIQGINYDKYMADYRVNNEAIALYDKAMATNDPAERLDYWRKAQEILREDCPWVFLSHTKRHALAWDHVGNYIPTDFPYGMEKHYYVREGAKDKLEARQ